MDYLAAQKMLKHVVDITNDRYRYVRVERKALLAYLEEQDRLRALLTEMHTTMGRLQFAALHVSGHVETLNTQLDRTAPGWKPPVEPVECECGIEWKTGIMGPGHNNIDCVRH